MMFHTIQSIVPGIFIDFPLISMITNITQKNHGYYPWELKFVAEMIKAPPGTCVCESNDGGFYITHDSDDLIDSYRYILWSDRLSPEDEISDGRSSKEICSGNFFRRK